MLDSRVSDSLPGSYYAPLAEEFHRHVTRVPQGATDRFKYAVNLVTQSLSPLPQAWFWHGSYTRWTRLYDIFGWRTVWNLTLWKWFNLKKLQQAHEAHFKRGL
ncbi:hypothetical protein F4801DRAFT_573735 [Xylaria longipes]|nr:hypothetical protein F4801DRAFT_573735 [Xylaria longipes]